MQPGRAASRLESGVLNVTVTFPACLTGETHLPAKTSKKFIECVQEAPFMGSTPTPALTKRAGSVLGAGGLIYIDDSDNEPDNDVGSAVTTGRAPFPGSDVECFGSDHVDDDKIGAAERDDSDDDFEGPASYPPRSSSKKIRLL